jgi:hypothetical protein
MTTGRINQVTTLQAGPAQNPKTPGDRDSIPRRRGDKGQKITQGWDGPPESEHARPCDRTAPVKRWPSQVIQLPPLSSPRRGPPQQNSLRPSERTSARLWHTRLKRRIPPTITSKRAVFRGPRRLSTTAYLPRSNVRIVAKGQSSTDLKCYRVM